GRGVRGERRPLAGVRVPSERLQGRSRGADGSPRVDREGRARAGPVPLSAERSPLRTGAEGARDAEGTGAADGHPKPGHSSAAAPPATVTLPVFFARGSRVL